MYVLRAAVQYERVTTDDDNGKIVINATIKFPLARPIHKTPFKKARSILNDQLAPDQQQCQQQQQRVQYQRQTYCPVHRTSVLIMVDSGSNGIFLHTNADDRHQLKRCHRQL